jgi:hypothetical protein
MKKILFLALSFVLVIGARGQEKTMNLAYWKVKLGQRNLLYKAMAEHNAKYRPAGGEYAMVAFNIVGGDHHGEIAILSNLGKSFADRDKSAPMPDAMLDDAYKTIMPYLESITGGDVLVYKPDYSNSAFSDRTEKILSTIYYLKFSNGNEFWDVVKKLPKAWTQAKMNIAAYVPTTGSSRLVFSRRMPNGWSELDENKQLSQAYDAVYGKGTYDKDVQLFRSGVEKKETIMMTLNKEISSK